MNKLCIRIICFLCLFVLQNCEENLNTETRSTDSDFCDPIPPNCLPGTVGNWEICFKSDTINTISVTTIHPQKPYILFIGTNFHYSDRKRAYIYKSNDYGQTWEKIIEASGIGQSFRDIIYNPINPNIIYVANNTYLVKSYDCGKTWQNITGDIQLNLEKNISDIAINPVNPEIVYLGTNGFYGGNLYKSTNGGYLWRKINSDIIHSASSITINPQNPNIIYLATDGNIVKSTNAGETWKLTGLHDTGLFVYDILIDNENPNIIYAILDHFLDPIFEVDLGGMKSNDAGLTWERYNNGLPINKIFVPHRIVKNTLTKEFYLTLTLGDGGNTQLYKMVAGSASWEMIQEWPRSDPIQGYLKFSPEYNMFYFANNYLYRMRLN